MDFATIAVAVISLIGTLVGSYLSNSKSTALIAYRMEQLERKVEQHNSVIERTYKLEKDMNTAFIRIDELRESIHHD